MKTQENKQKAIELGYGEYWDIVKDFVDENGWCDFTFTKDTNILIPIEMNLKFPLGRPKSLSGIEDNNGWISINSIEYLPKDEGSYFVYSKTEYPPYFRVDIFTGRLSNTLHHATGNPIFSHYQPIEKPKKPIY